MVENPVKIRRLPGGGAAIAGEAGRGHLAMLAFSALVAGSLSLGSLTANLVTPAALTTVRFAIAGLVLGIAAMFGPGIRRSDMAAPWRYLVLGGTFATYFVLMFEGLKTAPPVSASAVFTLVPLMAALLSWLLLRERLSALIALALGIGAAGALWVIFRGDPAALLAFDLGRGEMIYFVGCIFHAVYIPLVKMLSRGERAIVLALGTTLGSFALLAIYGAGEVMATDWANLPPIAWITLFYLAVVTGAATTVMLQYGALRLTSAQVMAYTFLTPSWVILWQIALGGAIPGAIVLPGIGLTILALLVLMRA